MNKFHVEHFLIPAGVPDERSVFVGVASPYSLFPVPYSFSLFPVPCSLFPIPYSLFPTPFPCSLFPVF